MSYRKWQMGNGLWVVHKEMPNPLVALTIHIKGGSSVEQPEEIGSAHFLEHMVFKAGEKFPSEELISGLIEQEGAMPNAYTSHDRICFYALTQSNVELMFDILSDCIIRPLFKADDISTELGRVLQEIAEDDDDPKEVHARLFSRMIWGRHPYGESITGTAEQVSSLTRDTFLNYHAKYFVPRNMVLSVAGGIKSEKVFELAFKYFGDGFERPYGRAILPSVDFSYVPDRKLFLRENDLKQLKCTMGTLPAEWIRSQKGFEKSRVTATLLGVILGGGTSSRLFSKVSSQKGLVYYIQAGASVYENAGNFRIDFGADPVNVVPAVAMIFDELDSILINGITEKELQKAKNIYKTSVATHLESALNIAFACGSAEMHGLDLHTSEEFFDSYVDPVTVIDIMAAAKDLLPKSKFYLAALGKVADNAKALESMLS